MFKRILIISPYFPPVNAADMQRVRMSLPYFEEFNWQAEIVTVDEKYSDMALDPLLLQSIPPTINIHKVKAFDKALTSKIGLGSIALRSLWYYRRKVNALLKHRQYDLIYFSSTQFPVFILGAYWKRKFGIPYILDMQDPWHSDFYLSMPRAQRPPKYWFAYHFNKYLEPVAVENTNGMISVSENYIHDLKERYPVIKNIPASVITFGAFRPDLEIARNNQSAFPRLLDPQKINIVYIGRGGVDIRRSVFSVLKSFHKGLTNNRKGFADMVFSFIGTSYAPAGQGKPTILPIATELGITSHVTELTDRISYYHTLLTLQQADVLFLPGSDDPGYTASKIYPYMLSAKPILAVINSDSPANAVLSEYGAEFVYNYDNHPDIEEAVIAFLSKLASGTLAAPVYDERAIIKYDAVNMTRQQCELFDTVTKPS